MATFLFDEIIFGPVQSRRLGVSLGINLLPTDSKFCNFNCIYCECGWTPEKGDLKSDFHSFEVFSEQLESFLKEYDGKAIDNITFAGNGEPTLHPKFEEIIDETIRLRDLYYPKAKISVLSNATMLHSDRVVKALKKVENRILKLDSAIPSTNRIMNQPKGKFDIDTITKNMLKFDGNFILQTMFLKGNYKGECFDNTSEKEIVAWLDLIKKLKPRMLMIYTIARDTPHKDLEKISIEKLNQIAKMVEQEGFKVQVSG